MNFGYLLQALETRLPELEWQMGFLGAKLSEHVLPKGLFRPCLDPTPAFYIQEIKTDIKTLSNQDSFRSAEFLAKRIHQKINVLIALCNLQKNTAHIERPLQNIARAMQTRKQRVEAIESEISALTAQQKAMDGALEKLQMKSDTEAMIQLQKDLSLVNRQLTLAKERLGRV